MFAEGQIASLMHSARLKMKMGNWLASLNTYRRIIEEKPDYLPAYCELARLYLDRNDLRGARHVTSRIIDLDPKNTEAHFILGVIEYIEGNFSAALQSYHVVKEIDGLDCNLAMNMALAYEAIGMKYEAIRNLEYAVAQGDPNSKVYEILAELYQSIGELFKAVRILKKGIRRFPHDSSLHSCLGKLHHASESYLPYVEYLGDIDESASSEQVSEPSTHAEDRESEPEISMEFLKAVCEAESGYGDNVIRLARSYAKKGDLNYSLKLLEEARRKFPDNPSIGDEIELMKSAKKDQVLK